MSRETQTPADLAIRPRDIAFARGSPAAPRLWLGGDPIATAFFNALSASFPQGERFFMDSVRPYRGSADAKLAGQIAAFTTQEAVHSREHLVFNTRIAEDGFDFSRIDLYLKKRFDFGRKLPRLNQLCATIALEHFTAILAHAVLSDGRDLAGAPPEIRRMWQWHAIEEIEHKAVAFDTFLMATRRFSPLRRWWIRCVSMVLSTIMFLQFLWFGTREFFRHYGIDNPRSRRALLRYLWIEPGLMRRAAPAYFAYYRPGFHPWRVDDRALIADVETALAAGDAAA
ncbi:MAG TPA: metal-dependent hydrolase [Rhizomicrobium sp.]|nr:metal-dependent hydrolase [Rhizomicrobium sp.]